MYRIKGEAEKYNPSTGRVERKELFVSMIMHMKTGDYLVYWTDQESEMKVWKNFPDIALCRVRKAKMGGCVTAVVVDEKGC